MVQYDRWGKEKPVRRKVGRDEEVSKRLSEVSNSKLFSCSVSIRKCI